MRTFWIVLLSVLMLSGCGQKPPIPTPPADPPAPEIETPAVPMAARVSQMVGQKYNPGNFLLMHAMGPNVAGVIGSAIAAGVLISLYG